MLNCCEQESMFYELGWFYSMKSKRSWFESPYKQEILLSFALYNFSASMVWIQKGMLILFYRNLIMSWKTRRWKWTLIIESCIQFWTLRHGTREVIFSHASKKGRVYRINLSWRYLISKIEKNMPKSCLSPSCFN